MDHTKLQEVVTATVTLKYFDYLLTFWWDSSKSLYDFKDEDYDIYNQENAHQIVKHFILNHVVPPKKTKANQTNLYFLGLSSLLVQQWIVNFNHFFLRKSTTKVIYEYYSKEFSCWKC